MPSKPQRTRPRRGLACGAVAVVLALFWVCLEAGFYPPSAVLDEVRAEGRRLVAGTVRAAKDLAAALPGVVLDRPYFAVQQIKIFGAEAADRAEIIAGAGLRRGLSIWRIDPRELERRVAAHPWVKQALVRREFPRRVVVSVEEWRPAAIVALERLYYVDAAGVVFKAVGETDPVDLPLITGVRSAGLPLEERSTQKKLSEVLALARAVEGANLRLSEIRFLPNGEIVLYPTSVRVPFAMGWGDWHGKLLRLKRFLREWHGQEAHFAAVDMSFAGQAVVRLRRTL